MYLPEYFRPTLIRTTNCISFASTMALTLIFVLVSFSLTYLVAVSLYRWLRMRWSMSSTACPASSTSSTSPSAAAASPEPATPFPDAPCAHCAPRAWTKSPKSHNDGIPSGGIPIRVGATAPAAHAAHDSSVATPLASATHIPSVHQEPGVHVRHVEGGREIRPVRFEAARGVQPDREEAVRDERPNREGAVGVDSASDAAPADSAALRTMNPQVAVVAAAAAAYKQAAAAAACEAIKVDGDETKEPRDLIRVHSSATRPLRPPAPPSIPSPSSPPRLRWLAGRQVEINAVHGERVSVIPACPGELKRVVAGSYQGIVDEAIAPLACFRKECQEMASASATMDGFDGDAALRVDGLQIQAPPVLDAGAAPAAVCPLSCSTSTTTSPAPVKP
jgi:hypothetical protein